MSFTDCGIGLDDQKIGINKEKYEALDLESHGISREESLGMSIKTDSNLLIDILEGACLTQIRDCKSQSDFDHEFAVQNLLHN